jgi:hypothetical protein
MIRRPFAFSRQVNVAERGRSQLGMGFVSVEKDHAYVLTTQGKDQKLRVVSEGMNEAGNTVPATRQQP